MIKRHRLLYGETTILIDNSAANAFRTCPWLYKEQYLTEGTGLQHKPYPGEDYNSLQFGTRMHELEEEHYKKVQLYDSSSIEALEIEAQLVMEAYKAHYPEEAFTVVDVENTFRVPLPNSHHFYVGKLDLVIKPDPDVNLVDIMDHKTQQRSSKNNSPVKWAMRDQATLYLWAAAQLYPQFKIGNFWVNILIRPSEKMVKGPSFDRQKLERTPWQIETAVRDITMVADQIEAFKAKYGDGIWPANRENCYTWGQCEFYQPHLYGWSESIREEKYEPKTPYLFHVIQ